MRVKVDKVFQGNEISVWGHYLAIWEVSLQDFDLTTLHHELQTIKWKGYQPQGDLRLTMNHPPLDSIHLFKNKFESLKDDILDQLYETGSELIKSHWHRGLEYYKANTSMAFDIYKDLPGFSMGPHIDNAHIMFQLLINISENDTGTTFHNLTIAEPAYTATGNQGKGIIFINNPNSAHSITDVTKDRYMIYATIGF
jgi:hypothetical protein